jgi:hypothetical protein
MMKCNEREQGKRDGLHFFSAYDVAARCAASGSAM